MAEALTVREQVIEAFIALVQSMTVGDTAPPALGDSGSDLWSNVYRGNLDTVKGVACPAAGVYEGEEQTIALTYPFIDKVLRVYIEFKFPTDFGVDPNRLFNYYLGRLVKELLSDLNLGGLTRNIEEIGSNNEVEPGSKSPQGGTLVLEVQYRHRNGDPFTKL